MSQVKWPEFGRWVQTHANSGRGLFFSKTRFLICWIDKPLHIRRGERGYSAKMGYRSEICVLGVRGIADANCCPSTGQVLTNSPWCSKSGYRTERGSPVLKFQILLCLWNHFIYFMSVVPMEMCLWAALDLLSWLLFQLWTGSFIQKLFRIGGVNIE